MVKSKAKKIYLFSNGSQFADWQHTNCCNCKHNADTYEDSTCPVEDALAVSFWGDGSFSQKDAEKIGYPDKPLLYNWPCRSASWKEKYIKEQADAWRKEIENG